MHIGGKCSKQLLGGFWLLSMYDQHNPCSECKGVMVERLGGGEEDSPGANYHY